MNHEKTKPKSTSGIGLRAGWMAEPLTRAGVEFETIKNWLKKNRALQWKVIDSVARYFHPDYQFDQNSRQLIPNRPSGALVYWMMECGQFNPKLIEGVAPNMRKLLPAKFRGVPVEHAFNVLLTSAWLACHEYERIHETHEEKPVNDEQLFRHLYWFTRFSAVWHRTHAAKPPSLPLVNVKRANAKTWQDNLKKFRDDYLARHPSAKTREVVVSFLKPEGAKDQSFDRHYRWALKNLQ